MSDANATEAKIHFGGTVKQRWWINMKTLDDFQRFWQLVNLQKLLQVAFVYLERHDAKGLETLALPKCFHNRRKALVFCLKLRMLTVEPKLAPA